MNVFTDKHGNKYEILWQQPDVTMCGFFTGTTNNIHEWIHANLGYGNKIARIKNIKNGKEYWLGQEITFNWRKLNSDLQEVKTGTINGFYVDSFSGKLGATIEDVGRCELTRFA